MDKVYSWKRFWCPRDGEINLSDRGFLVDPDSRYGAQLNPNVEIFESISGKPCLILLGEPGIGKSFTLNAEFERYSSPEGDSGDQYLKFDLRAYQTDIFLHQAIFEDSRLQAWKGAKHKLHLYLDSLDECLINIRTIAAQLAEEIQELPTGRLNLRIACRTANWPIGLENDLRKLWPENEVGVYELTPLCRSDVLEAAQIEGIEPQSFIETIEQVEAVPFAIKPITLTLLINLFKRDGSLPTSKKEIYLRGCRLLCQESDESRYELGEGHLSADQRLIVAARIATLTTIGNRYAIWQGLDLGDVPDADVAIYDLAGGTERVAQIDLEVTDEAIRETLGVGLFSSRGSQRIGWAHQTYAEFLTAWYFTNREVPANQLIQLLIHPGDPEGKVPPQLHETAAWLAGFRAEIFEWLAQVEPGILLRTDATAYTDEDKRTLVSAILNDSLTALTIYRQPGSWRSYKYLKHSKLPNQLRAFIHNSEQHNAVRLVALDIAGECDIQELAQDLLMIAEDQEQPFRIRMRAIRSITRLSENEEVLTKLKPIILENRSRDPDDELKGLLLRALWPCHISTQELFEVLTPPQRENLFGSYRGFLSLDLAQHLEVTDLPIALRWVGQTIDQGWQDSVEEPINQILMQAWRNLETPGVLEMFARIAFVRIHAFDQIISGNDRATFSTELQSNHTRRRFLAREMIAKISDPRREAFWLAHGQSPVIFSIDILWMIEQLDAEHDPKAKATWAYLISSVLDRTNNSHIEAVYSACSRSPELDSSIGWLFRPVLLDSQEAKNKREQYELAQQNVAKRHAQLNAIRQTYVKSQEQVEPLLQKCETGDTDARWRLNLVLLEKPDEGFINELDPTLTDFPMWQDADLGMRARILEAAKNYIHERDSQPSEWIGKNTIYRPAFAGYRAFRLLYHVEPELLETLSADVWKRWAPILLAFPTHRYEEREIQEKLIAQSFLHASQEMIGTLETLIEKENEESGHLYALQKVEEVHNQELDEALLRILGENRLNPTATSDLLALLIDREVDGAQNYAESILKSKVPTDPEKRRKYISVAQALICHAQNAGWDTIWPQVEADEELGKDIFLSVAEISDELSKNIVSRLTEEQVADLYIWLERVLPSKDDPSEEGAHIVTPREMLGQWRDSLLRSLAFKGTYNACHAIKKVMASFGHLNIEFLLNDALTKARYSTWLAPSPSEILAIVRSARTRLVRNGEELLDVIIESLSRLEEELQGETPAAPDLWNEIERGRYQPKDEPSLSDYVKRFFDRDLGEQAIIVNREVEIRGGEGSGRGEETDIHVDAIINRSGEEVYDRIKVIIEVKGSWHDELKSAMETQLLNRYLCDSDCRHGIYLVGWFKCDQWNKDRSGRVCLDS